MMRSTTRAWRAVQVVLFLLFFAVTVALNLTCKPEDNPAASPECGSGRVSWDAKGQVCRDLADKKIIPNKCCGR